MSNRNWESCDWWRVDKHKQAHYHLHHLHPPKATSTSGTKSIMCSRGELLSRPNLNEVLLWAISIPRRAQAICWPRDMARHGSYFHDFHDFHGSHCTVLIAVMTGVQWSWAEDMGVKSPPNQHVFHILSATFSGSRNLKLYATQKKPQSLLHLHAPNLSKSWPRRWGDTGVKSPGPWLHHWAMAMATPLISCGGMASTALRWHRWRCVLGKRWCEIIPTILQQSYYAENDRYKL